MNHMKEDIKDKSLKMKPLQERFRISAKRLFKFSSESLLFYVLFLMATIPHCLILWDCKNEVLTISENSLFYVFSTGASLVGGLYGITLTGYIFFLEHLEAGGKEDETLLDPIALLKKKYNRNAIEITVLTFLTIMASIFLLLYGTDNTQIPTWGHRFMMEETIWLITGTIFCIMCFILQVVDPNKIQRISERYKERLSVSDDTDGDYEQFMQDCSEIEDMLVEMGMQVGGKFTPKNIVKTSKQVFSSKAGVAKKGLEELNDPIWEDLNLLREYRNYAMHSADKAVSRQMCDFATSLKEDLRAKLHKEEDASVR
ncbi:MAG: hypothetical protein LUF92_07225 [Clostridiales bacterium]|nr:hypothetical protein [Clostridiales bacterium]